MHLPPLYTQPSARSSKQSTSFPLPSNTDIYHLPSSEHLQSNRQETLVWWTLLGCSLAGLHHPLSLLPSTRAHDFLHPASHKHMFRPHDKVQSSLVLIHLYYCLPEGFNSLPLLCCICIAPGGVLQEFTLPPLPSSQAKSCFLSNSKSQIHPKASQEAGHSISHVLTTD